MRYLFWFCINEIFLYPFSIAIVLPFYFVFEGELWAVVALAFCLCLLSSFLARYLGKSLITLTAAKASVFASKGQLQKAMNRLIYLSRILPSIRSEVRAHYGRQEDLSKVVLMELAVKCMRLDDSDVESFSVVSRLLYAAGLLLSLLAVLARLIG